MYQNGSPDSRVFRCCPTTLIHDYLFRRTKRKRRSNGDSFDEGDVSGYEEEEDNAHNHHLDDSGIGRYVETLQYFVTISPRVTTVQ